MITDQKIEGAFVLLQYAIDNDITITKTLSLFKKNDRYLRGVRKDIQGHKREREFKELYDKALNKIIAQPHTTTQSIDGLLDKSFEVKEDRVSFEETLGNKGILDARGRLHVRTLDQLIAEAKIDLQIWEIERHVVNKWDVTNAKGETHQNWQVKVWLKKRVEVEQAINAVELFKELIAENLQTKNMYP